MIGLQIALWIIFVVGVFYLIIAGIRISQLLYKSGEGIFVSVLNATVYITTVATLLEAMSNS